jgi:hypothetical protein
MTAEEVINLIGGICGLIFFVFIAWLVIKKPPFDGFDNGGIHP